MKRILLGLSLSCLVFSASGCPPSPPRDSSLMPGDKVWEAVIHTHEMSRETGRPHYLSETDLLRMKGTADLTIRMGELPELIEKDWEKEPGYTEYAHYQMQRLYTMYQWALEDRGETVDANAANWRTSKRFNNLDVWFYGFHTGPEIRVYGGLFPLFGRGTGTFATSCFLLENSRVLDCASLERPVTRRKKVLREKGSK